MLRLGRLVACKATRPPHSLHAVRYLTQRVVFQYSPPSLETSIVYDELSFDSHALSVHTENARLRDLVTLQKYGAADRVRIDLEAQGIEIELDAIYERAALKAFEDNINGTSVGLFSAWMQLCLHRDHPDATLQNKRIPYSLIRNSLFLSGKPVESLPFVMRYGLICAGKGYIKQAYDDTLPILMEHCNPDYGFIYLVEMEKLAVEYELMFRPENATPLSRQYRNYAIEVCLKAGWNAQAVKIFKQKRNFPLEASTYSLLIQCFKHWNSTMTPQMVDKAQKRDEQRARKGQLLQMKLRPINRKSMSLPRINDDYQLSLPPPIPQEPSSDVRSPTTRVKVARELRQLIRGFRFGYTPKPDDLYALLRDYGSVSPSPAFALLAKIAASSVDNGKSYHLFRTAEMQYHASRSDYRKALTIFVSRFQSSSLPLSYQEALAQLGYRSPLSERNFRTLKSGTPLFWLVIEMITRESAACLDTSLEVLYNSLRDTFKGATERSLPCQIQSLFAEYGIKTS